MNYRRADGSNPETEQRLWDRPVLILNAHPPRFQLEANQAELVVDLQLKGVERLEEDKRNSYRPYIDISEATEAGEYYAPVHVLRIEDEDKTVEPIPQIIRLNLRPIENVPVESPATDTAPESTVPAASPSSASGASEKDKGESK